MPTPETFDVDEIDEVSLPNPGGVTVTWSPVLDGATIDISILPLDDGCLTVVGGGAGDVAKGVDDSGEYRLDTDVYHAVDHDCSYELIFERRFVESVPGRWFKDGRELPANGVWAVGLHTTRANFVAGQR